jgi:hypothetical protein
MSFPNFHVASVEINKYVYPNEDGPTRFNRNHVIDASTEDEAREKVKKFYEDKSDEYGISYDVIYIEFFEKI